MNKIETLFFELLQLAIGRRDRLSCAPSDEEWYQLFDLSKKQALDGIVFCALENIPVDQCPPKPLIFQWSAHAAMRNEDNALLNARCEEICLQFAKDGFRSCILKGQSNLVNYPQALSEFRTSGDIDIWVRPMREMRHPIREVIEYVIAHTQRCRPTYHHVDFRFFNDADVEVHQRPTFLCSPVRNRRLQRWCDQMERHCVTDNRVGDHTFPVPTPSFNVVYQLLHIYKHLFESGIGLRQMLDYYMVLSRWHELGSPNQDEVNQMMASLGLHTLAASVMYVLQMVFAMPDDYLICPVDEKAGSFLLDEIMLAGNFGRYDKRLSHSTSKGKHAVEKFIRNFRFFKYFPEEVFCEPFYRLFHCGWRVLRLWRF